MPFLKSSEFVKAVDRNIFHTRSSELKGVINALRAHEKKPTKDTIQQIGESFISWKKKHPKEFAARFASNEASFRTELIKEYAKYGLTFGLATDLGDAKPFLVNSATGKPMQAEFINNRFYYHATNFGNLKSIKVSGLDPNFGGHGGASDQVKSPQFKARSAGKVHASTSTHTATFYGLLHDEPSLFVKAYGAGLFPGGIPADPKHLKKMTVILRFSKACVRPSNVEKDPDDPRNAWRIYSRISPLHIEALTTEGWVPILKLVELDAALGP